MNRQFLISAREVLVSKRCRRNARHVCDVLSSQTCLSADLTNGENIWKKIVPCVTPSFFLSLGSLPPSMPLRIAMHITTARAVRKCIQLKHRPFTNVWDEGINHQLGFENHNQETAVATAVQYNDKICRATWKRTRSVSFCLCAIERHVNKHVHFYGFYCNNNFLALLDFFIIFLRVIMLIKALLHGTVNEKAHSAWAYL